MSEEEKIGFPSYDQLVDLIHRIPMTWVPAIMIELVEHGYEKKVFLPYEASAVIAKLETQIGKAKPEEKSS